MAPVEVLQMEEETRAGWINYSAFDAKATHQLYSALKAKLRQTPCVMDASICAVLGTQNATMWDLYQQFWCPFGELLTNMEKEGMLVNR